MLENKDYCDYETCVALCELGMRITSRRVYSDRNTLKHSSRGITYTVRTASAMGWVIAIPLYEAQKFLREKEIMVYPQYMTNGQTWMCLVYEEKKMLMRSIGRGSYNEVLNEGIKEAVKILKEK